jgi:hypothetical protein
MAPHTDHLEEPLGTRALTGLAATVFTAGCILGAVGLPPAVDSPALFRLGALLAVASIPAWIAVSTKASARLTDDQLSDAHMAGYQQCLDHLGTVGGTERHDR